MNIKDIFNKLFNISNNATSIINLNEVIKLPNRSDITNDEITVLIDKYKNEYLRILSTKKYILSDELTSKHIHEELKMNMDLIMNLYLSYEEIPNNKIDIIIKYLKLKLYLDKINELGNEVLTRLIALTEISKEKVFLSKQKKHRVVYEINNLLSIMIMFNSQKYALERECESYFNKLLSLSTDMNLTGEEQEKVNKKLKDVYKIAREVISDINVDKYQGLIGLVALERELEIYVYNNKEEANELKWMVGHPTLIIPPIDNIENLIAYELKYRLFNEYGRNLITDEDLLELYGLKFRMLIKHSQFKDYNIQLVTEETTDKELECYKIIVMEMIENIVRDSNKKIKEVFDNNTNKAIRYMIKVLKDGEDIFNSDKILRDKFLLNFLLVFSYPKYLNDFVKTYKISPKLMVPTKFSNATGMYDLQYITSLHERLFRWEDELPLDTIFKIDNINQRIANIDSSVDYIMKHSNNKLFDRMTYLKKLYLLKHNPKYDFIKKGSEYNITTGEQIFYRNFYLPEGLKSISITWRPDSDSLFLKCLMQDIDNSTVYFPKSLLKIEDNIFLEHKVNAIKLNEGLQYVDSAIFEKQNIAKISLPPSIKTFLCRSIPNVNTIEIRNFKESYYLLNPESLYLTILKTLNINMESIRYHHSNETIIFYNASTSFKKIILVDDKKKYVINCPTIKDKIVKNKKVSENWFSHNKLALTEQVAVFLTCKIYDEIKKVTKYSYDKNLSKIKKLSKFSKQ